MVERRGRFVVKAGFLGAGVNDYLVSNGFRLSLSMSKGGFHDLLRVGPSFLLMLFGCIEKTA